jgi:VWFA-related protein
MRPLQALFLASALTLPMHGQNVVIPTPKIVVTPNQVNVLTLVRDKKGIPLTNLTKADFALQADRHPQTLLSADPVGNTPVTLGLLFDTSRIASTLLDDEREAAAAFLNTTLIPGNKAFLVQFASQVQLVEDTTAAGPTLQRGLKDLTPAPAARQTAAVTAPDDPNQEAKPRSGTVLYDAIFLSTDEITAKLPTRRVLILLTDGIDKNSKESIGSAIESAQRADTVIYALYVQGDDRKLAKDSSRRNNDPTQPGSNNPNQRGGGNSNCPSNSGGSSYPRFPGGGGGLPGSTGGYPSSPGTGNNNCQSSKPTGADHKPFVDGHAVLDRICGETGGHVYDVTRHDTMQHAFDQIAEDLKAQYKLTFVPTNLDTTRDHYHQIDLNLTGSLAKSKPQPELRDGFFNNAKPD